jgi:hypothetical protein
MGTIVLTLNFPAKTEPGTIPAKVEPQPCHNLAIFLTLARNVQWSLMLQGGPNQHNPTPATLFVPSTSLLK